MPRTGGACLPLWGQVQLPKQQQPILNETPPHHRTLKHCYSHETPPTHTFLSVHIISSLVLFVLSSRSHCLRATSLTHNTPRTLRDLQPVQGKTITSTCLLYFVYFVYCMFYLIHVPVLQDYVHLFAIAPVFLQWISLFAMPYNQHAHVIQ